jgi:anti-anti-sigma factor
MVSPTTPEGGPPSHDELLAIDRDGVKVWAHCGRLVTLVSVSGDIDISNVDRVKTYITRSVLVGNSMLLDMSCLDFIAVQGISLLINVENTCRSVGLPWALVASRAVEWVLRYSQQRDALPVANSVPEAMRYFNHLAYAQARPRRACGLLPMPATTSRVSR